MPDDSRDSRERELEDLLQWLSTCSFGASYDKCQRIAVLTRQLLTARSETPPAIPAVLREACIEWQKHADHKDGLDNVESALYGAIVLTLQQGAARSMVTAPESALPKPDAVSLVGKKSIQLSYFGDVTPGEAKAAFERWIA